jgi:hypothetical protein
LFWEVLFLATLSVMPSGYRVDLRPAPLALLPEPARQAIVDRLRAGATIIIRHIERHKLIYRIGAITLTVLLGAGGLEHVFADPGIASSISSGSGITLGGSGLDVGAHRLYARLVGIGKWIIIIKGAFDTISSTVQGDFVAARKSGLAYMLVYVILLGLPWAFGQIEVLFQGM